jgi:hypothetical protein
VDDDFEFWNDSGDPTDEPKKPNGHAGDAGMWDEPDLDVVQLRRRAPPEFPLEVLGDSWASWAIDAANAAAAPVDYVIGPLLASVSALVGHARWAQAAPGWQEPPHLWMCQVGDSGDGKSPGADCLMRDVLPEIERRMIGDYPDRLREWRAADEFYKAAEKEWQESVKNAHKDGKPRRLRRPELPPTPRRICRGCASTMSRLSRLRRSSRPRRRKV